MKILSTKVNINYGLIRAEREGSAPNEKAINHSENRGERQNVCVYGVAPRLYDYHTRTVLGVPLAVSGLREDR